MNSLIHARFAAATLLLALGSLNLAAAVTVTITPTSGTVRLKENIDFDATVTGTTNLKVIWSVNGIAGGNATLGTISGSGLYVPPTVVPSVPIVIKVSSVAAPTVSASAPLKVWSSVPKMYTATPVFVNTGLKTVIKVKGANFMPSTKAVWNGEVLPTTIVSETELNAIVTTTAAAGTVAAFAVKNPEPGSLTTTPVNVTVWPPIEVVAKTPTLTVRAGETRKIDIFIKNAVNKAMDWSARGIPGGDYLGGTITADGVYTAPAVMPAPNVVEIKAVSETDPRASAKMMVTIVNAVPKLTEVPSRIWTGPVSFVVKGQGFAKDAIARLDGRPLSVTWYGADRMNLSGTAKLGAGGYAVLEIQNPLPGGGKSNLQAIEIGVPNAKMAQPHATRLVEKATFGASPDEIERAMTVGASAYLDEQFEKPWSTYPDPKDTNEDLRSLQARFFQNALTQPDQLRQRMTFALGQILVVSGNELNRYWKMVGYQRTLQRNAFGSYHALLREVALSPAMGEYLDMVNNAKADPAKGIVPNENFAREFLQLFTIGLYSLNMDGTRKIGPTGTPIAPYTEEDIRQLSKVFTGFTYPQTPGFASVWKNKPYYYGEMAPFDAYHDMSVKDYLGKMVGGGLQPRPDVIAAVENVFKHPNVAPFVSYRLIQQFVTGNPSPAYVERVAKVFENNGAGVKGDLRAVLKAILLDQDATAGYDTPGSGHLRQPVLLTTATLRALGAQVTGEPDIEWYPALMGQNIFYPASVFNYFSPFYRIPGFGVPSPEFQLMNAKTALDRVNFVYKAIHNHLDANVRVPIENFAAIASLGDEPLMNAVAKVFLRGTMPAEMKASILKAISGLTDPRQKAEDALYLAGVSSQFQVER
jgi:uncharacterized protein (DUF1800 family)